MAAYTWAIRRRRRLLSAPPDTVIHGANCYRNWACRCEVCTEGMREDDRLRVRERSSTP
jgi:hypothetical protein